MTHSKTDTRIMNADEELRAVEGVVDRLAAIYPDVSRDRIAAIVKEEYLQLEGNRIRDYIPVLVEHEARERLRAEGAHRAPVVETTSASEVQSDVQPIDVESQTETPLGGMVRLLEGDLGGAPS